MSFVDWMFNKADIDGLIIALIISNSVENFTKDFAKAIIEPTVDAFFPMDENRSQNINFGDTMIKLKLQYILSSFVKVLFNILLAYFIVKVIYKKIGGLK